MAPQGTSRNIRRNSQLGPSPLRHGLIAFVLAFTVLMGAYTGLRYLKNNAAEPKIDKVTISNTAFETQTGEGAISEPVSESATDIAQEQLPDLLGSAVPQNSNPTEQLAGANVPETTITPPPTNPEAAPTPRVIRINGQPAGRDSATPLIKAPIQGLSRQTPYGNVPAKAENGDTAFTRYAKPFQTNVNSKSVAIIIGGLGLDAEITTRAILDLPEQVTLSFAAHSPQLQNWIDQARENGHEVLLEIPMEANDSSDQASNTLIVTDDIAVNTRRLDSLLSKGSGYFAVTNYNGDKFLSRSDVVAPVMNYFSDAGLGFVFDGSFDAVALPALATNGKLPFIDGEMILDEIDNSTLTKSKLDLLSQKALTGSQPIGIGFAYRSTISSVTEWAETTSNQGIVLVPVSHLMTP